MFKEFQFHGWPPELKVGGSNPLGHAIQTPYNNHQLTQKINT